MALITPEQRDVLYEAGVRFLADVDDLTTAIQEQDWKTATRLAREISDVLRLFNIDLGWGPGTGTPVLLQTPEDVVLRVFELLAPQVAPELQNELMAAIEPMREQRPDPPAPRPSVEISPLQQKHLVREISTRLTGLIELPRCLAEESWDELEGYASEFADHLTFMVEDLQWGLRAADSIVLTTPLDVVERSAAYLQPRIVEGRTEVEQEAREAQEEVKEFQAIEASVNDLLDELRSGVE